MGCGASKLKIVSLRAMCDKPDKLQQDTPCNEGDVDLKVPKQLCSDQENLDLDGSDLEQPEEEDAENKLIRATTKPGQLRRSKTYMEKPTEEREIVLERNRRLGLQHEYAALQQHTVYATFNFLRHSNRSTHTYHFKQEVHFFDEKTDTAIIELDCTEEEAPKSCYSLLGPNPLEFDKFTLIGHTAGRPMALDTVNKIVDTNSEITRYDIEMVKRESTVHTGQRNSFEHPEHNLLSNTHRYLFHCKFSKGASGSPGVIVLDNDHIVVVTVLLHGYPDWYYDENVDQSLRSSWPKEYCIEQGAKMTSVFELMLQRNPELCRQIFSEPLPSPNIIYTR